MIRSLTALFAFLYLNALFTFENVPSMPSIRLAPRISVEVLVLLAALGLLATLGKRLGVASKVLLAAILYLATLIRYFEITALGVLGRPFDLYGDAPHLTRVFEMFWDALSLPLGVAILAGFVFVSAIGIALNWVAISTLERALAARWWRAVAFVAAPLCLGLYLHGVTKPFAHPVGAMVARQLDHLRARDSETRAAIDVPELSLPRGLPGLHHANVFLIFLESYGVTLIEDAPHFDAIGPRFRELEQHLKAAGYRFRSSQIQSPTFGGGSWRAHATLLSGVNVTSEHIYDALLKSHRATLVRLLHNEGYRTVAAEPGIKWYWPDGLFYGFDEIYDFQKLDWRGPAMGWWKIPDQYTLYRVHENEVRNQSQPIFAKFSLIMTHIPYYPVPTYVEDWTRFDDGTAYASGLKSVAHDSYRDLTELSSWYLGAFDYELDVLEGFLLSYVPDNSLVIIVGDHQPPKLATHDNDSWAVPMHVLSKRAELVEPFGSVGFEEGLVPLTPSSFAMSDFLDAFVTLFGSES
jgi:hypothetical protein